MVKIFAKVGVKPMGVRGNLDLPQILTTLVSGVSWESVIQQIILILI